MKSLARLGDNDVAELIRVARAFSGSATGVAATVSVAGGVAGLVGSQVVIMATTLSHCTDNTR